jgi:hypothetical protein
MNILDRFSKNTQMLNFMKILPVGADLFNVGGRTDMTKLTDAFRNSSKAPKNVKGVRSGTEAGERNGHTARHTRVSLSVYTDIWTTSHPKTGQNGSLSPREPIRLRNDYVTLMLKFIKIVIIKDK